jgi:hypothetical protein
MKRPAVDRPNLWLEQSRHEERVLGEFNRLNTGVIRAGADSESVTREALDVRRREAKVAPMKTQERVPTAQRMHSSSWNGSHGAFLRRRKDAVSMDSRRWGVRRCSTVSRSIKAHFWAMAPA